MPRRLLDLRGGRPFLDIAAYGRKGLARRDRLSQDEVELVARTVRKTPEVMVKVLTHGATDLKAVGRHLRYLNRGGDLELETDEGQSLKGEGIEDDLLADWDLDLDESRRTMNLEARPGRAAPRLVHKLLFSMPAGTPPERVLAAVKAFAREEFALKHRYAMVLHTDEPHPHVHVVVKALSELGARLNIRKATLREWRKQFARQLRAQGVAANATDRAVRGESKPRKSDGIYRATLRGDSTHTRERLESVASELLKGGLRVEPAKTKLKESRREVERGWQAMSEILVREGNHPLATQVRQFLHQMEPPRTEREWIAEEVLRRVRPPTRDLPRTR